MITFILVTSIVFSLIFHFTQSKYWLSILGSVVVSTLVVWFFASGHFGPVDFEFLKKILIIAGVSLIVSIFVGFFVTKIKRKKRGTPIT